MLNFGDTKKWNRKRKVIEKYGVESKPKVRGVPKGYKTKNKKELHYDWGGIDVKN